LREMRAGLTRRMNDTGSRADNALMKALYPAGHPFHEPDMDEQFTELDHINVTDLIGHHKGHYGPKGTILTIVGDIEPEEAIELVSAAFGDWQGPERKQLSVPTVNLPSAAETLRVNLNDKANVDILIGHPTELARSNKDFFAAMLANAVLGKDTISARLGKLIRVKHGLTYGVYSYFDDASFGCAPWLISLSVNPSNVSKSLALVKQVVDDFMKKGVTEEELEGEAGRAVGGFIVSLRSSDGIAAALCRFEFIGLGYSAMDTVADSYMAVTRKDVMAAIRKYFNPEKALTVLSGTMDRVV
jgi:zinc protease